MERSVVHGQTLNGQRDVTASGGVGEAEHHLGFTFGHDHAVLFQPFDLPVENLGEARAFLGLATHGVSQPRELVDLLILNRGHLLLGALHGLEPGHSKTIMAAFIIAIRGTVLQAILLGLSAAISHSLIIALLAALALVVAGVVGAAAGYVAAREAGTLADAARRLNYEVVGVRSTLMAAARKSGVAAPDTVYDATFFREIDENCWSAAACTTSWSRSS